MKYITDDGVRQIQPKELKYLSEADREIIEAFAQAMLSMCGYGREDAVVLGGLNINITNKPGQPIVCKVSKGYIYYREELYTAEAYEAVLENITDMKKLIVILDNAPTQYPPSPVRDESLSKTKNIHYGWKGTISRSTTQGEGGFALFSENTLYPTLKRIVEFQKKQTQAVVIGN